MRLSEADLAEITNKPNGPRLKVNHLAPARMPYKIVVPSKPMESVVPLAGFFVVPGTPIAKPRQTRSDKWNERPCVMKYRAWADKAREAMFHAMHTVSFTAGRLDVIAYFPIPKSYTAKERNVIQGFVHMVKPDADNILKAVADSLCKNDQMIHTMSICKRWDDGKGPRVEISIY